MAGPIKQHERTVTFVEYDWGDPSLTMQEMVLFGTPVDAERSARAHVASGDRNVKLVTEIWRWRGKTGKVTKQRTSEIEVK